MIKASNKSTSTQAFATRQMHGNLRPGPIAASTLRYEDIAQRAYEIHVEKGYPQGQSEQDWLQAERELKSRRNWLQDGWETKNRDSAGESCGPSKRAGSDRACSVCSKIHASAVTSEKS
jgi:hypothetical protein